MGIFKSPSLIAASSGTPLIFYLAWIAGGIIAFSGAITFSEIGRRMPETGAFYKIFAACYHPSIGFSINMLILIANAASLGIVALIGSDYLGDLLFGRPPTPTFSIFVSMCSILLFYTLNLAGLKSSSGVQNILTVLKVGLILILISSILGGNSAKPHGYDSGEVLIYQGSNGLYLLWLSLIPVCFTYGGYQQTINFGGEVKELGNLSTGIFRGILIVLFLYLTLNFAYIRVIGFENMKNASAIGAILFEAIFGKMGAKVFDIAMFLSVLAYVNVSLLMNPRIMVAMSKDGVLPAWIHKTHPGSGAYFMALSIFSVLTMAIVFLGKEVDNILGFTMFLDSLGMVTGAFTLFIMRKRNIGREHINGDSPRYLLVLAGFFVTLYALVALAVFFKSPLSALTGVLLLAFFLTIFFVEKIKLNRR
jgi:APA family basic amino acid/polyamine antiporter